MDPEKDKPESLDNAVPENNDEGDEAKAEKADEVAETKTTDEETPAEIKKDEGGETDIPADSEAKEGGGDEDPAPPPSALNIDKLSQEVDNYLSTLSALKSDGDESSIPQDVPNFVKQFSLMVEARIADYDSGQTAVKWSSLSEEESASFLEAITRLSSLSTALLAFSAHPNFARSINRIGAVLERAISYVEEEFKDLLDEYRFPDPNPNAATNEDETAKPEEEENAPPPEENAPPPPKEDNHFPGYEDEVLSNLIRLSKMMIAIGYETECCEAYTVARRNALEESVHKLGFEKHSIDDVQKMQWENLEREIASWVSIFKQCPTLLASERNLARAVFPASTSDRVLCGLAQGLSATVLNFAVAVALTKTASEKLFKFLDTYEALRDVLPTLESLFPEQEESWLRELRVEGGFIKTRLGEATVSIFSEMETSIRTDAGKTPVPGGAIHPLTRYIMNYLNYACEYKESIEHIFKEHHRNDGAESSGSGSPFQGQVTKMMELLDESMEAKSKLYKDHALGAIFLMNNGRYVLQKVRGSNEISSLTGDAWCRKKSTDLRQYHKVYQRETWGKLLSYLHPDGLTSHGKVVKPVLKERFKNFNAMFDEIRRTQTTWVVCDDQLQSELRVSISNMVVPAYRSFLGRYGQVFTPGRQTEKYVKFQGEEIENSIEELFDGKK